MTRPPVQIHARKAMTQARKERIWTAHLGRCEECQAPVPMDGPGVQYDHIIPLWKARPGDIERLAELELDANLQTLCTGCHDAKTRAEAPARAKAKRLAGETCTAPTRRPLQGRGFDTTRSRGFDGKVRPRQQKAHADA